MSPQADDKNISSLDTVWLVASIAALVGAVTAFYYFQTEYSTPIRVVGLLVAIGVSAAMLYQTRAGRTIWAYVQGSRLELRKTTWPTRQEGLQTTLVVAVVVLVVALILWGVDSALLWGVKRLTGQA